VDEGVHEALPRCLYCGSKTSYIGIKADALPFWRRLDKSFRYPMKTSILLLILFACFFEIAASFAPLPVYIILSLWAVGIIFKYGITCLYETAMGHMNPPDITSSLNFNDGTILVIKFLAIGFGVVVISGKIAIFAGDNVARFFIYCFVAATPAAIILYALTDSLRSAVNPFKVFSLIVTIGLPYGLLLGLLLMMRSSVFVLQELVALEASYLSAVAQSFIQYFYLIVTFHIMGYMIFQYQDELGYKVEERESEEIIRRPENEKLLVKIQLYCKQGRLTEAHRLFHRALEKFPNDRKLLDLYFEFALSALPKKPKFAEKVVNTYLNHLVQTSQNDRLVVSYKRTLLTIKNYVPDSPRVAFRTAQICQNKGDYKTVVRLLGKIHKTDPEFPMLAEAHQLLLSALKEIPEYSDVIPRYERLAQAIVK
jgi:hypothetical protein